MSLRDLKPGDRVTLIGEGGDGLPSAILSVAWAGARELRTEDGRHWSVRTGRATDSRFAMVRPWSVGDEEQVALVPLRTDVAEAHAEQHHRALLATRAVRRFDAAAEEYTMADTARRAAREALAHADTKLAEAVAALAAAETRVPS